jgi:hypothetical protein
MWKQWCLVVLIGVSFGAHAEIKDRDLNRADFAEQAEAIRDGMQPDGPYAHVRPRQRVAIERDLETMASLLADHESARQMPPDDLVSLYNAQERVNAVLMQREQQRQKCERRRVLGSNIPKTVCESYGEWKRAQRQFGENEKMRLQQCRGSGCQGQ